MAAAKPPRLTIGLPVYNGERFLKFALDSILGQSFKDFELIICDNASTDETMLICKEYSSRDSRIRYYRNHENIGAAANFNRTFELAHGTYFKWAAADDIISPSFVEKCVQILDDYPDVVLSYTKVDRINSSGEVDGTYDYPMRVHDASPGKRFSDLILINHFCVAVFGVVRREVLSKTPLIGKYVGSDRVLLAELGLLGKLFEVPEYLFHRRDHPQASGRLFNMVNWKIAVEYIRAINRVPLTRKEKIACYRVMVRWFIKRRSALLEDIKAAILQIFPFSHTLVKHARRLQNKRINTGGGL
jgi:glycosyltransferase involved in cell wall biosynthesis